MAIKVHNQEPGYLRERDTYLRLQRLGLATVRSCNVPELIAYYDEVWIIVMTVVVRPFVLDFGGEYLDQAPEFSEEVLADWQTEKQEQFGPNWHEVQAIINELRQHGIYLVDVNPRNISFGVKADQTTTTTSFESCFSTGRPKASI